MSRSLLAIHPAIPSLCIRLMKGVVVAILSIVWTSCEQFRDRHHMSFVCGVVLFFLFRAMATFPIPWRSFIAGMSKVFETVYGAVRSAGSRV
ncbi:hypothetical protein BC826DRAFT_1046373 [Russula brevipes]|nr:hypothetical protein BC826DRAFT_1046373 [Russula brevipes]